MSSLLGDLRYALRRARSRAGFTLIAIVSLGLGIGVNTAAFSLINAILLRKTPLREPERVADLYNAQGASSVYPLSYPDYKDLRDRSHAVFKQFSLSRFSIVPRDMGDHVQTLTTELVNGDYFPLMGLAPQLGRLLGPDDDSAEGQSPVVVLSYDYWQHAFNADPSIVGQQLHLSGRAYTIVGVASNKVEGLMPGLAPALYLPVQMENQLEPGNGFGSQDADVLAERGNHSYFASVRLADGQTMTAARTVIAQFVSDMRTRYPKDWPATLSMSVIPLSKVAVNPMIDGVVAPAASVLMIVVALVLVVACANLASFLLAQARDRQREIAIRLAIGATRRALVRQLLTESLLLAAIGGALGVLISTTALKLVLGADLPVPIPLHLDVSPDARVLAFVIAVSLAAGVLFGLLPALQATRPNVVETIKNENAGAKPGRRFSMRSALVVAQTATSLVLLVTAALFLRSFAAQSKVDPGFGGAPAGLVWTSFQTGDGSSLRRSAPSVGVSHTTRQGSPLSERLADLERRVRGVSDVSNVGIAENMMLNPLSRNDMPVNVDGFTPPKGTPGFDVDYTVADSGFFDAAGIAIVRGRSFNTSDSPDKQRVAIVNEVMAARFWPGADPIGKTFRADTAVYRIVGISKTTKVRSLGESPQPFIFGAWTQRPTPDFYMVARSRGDAARTAQSVVTAAHEADPSIMIIQAKTMAQHLAAMVLPARLGAVAFAVFAGLALVLAMIGIYGVVRYAVSRRSREVAIRLAVGAKPSEVVGLLMREGVVLVGIGALIGIGLGWVASRGLGALLYGVSSGDPATFLVTPVVLLVVGGIAAFLPARRVTKVDPSAVLRGE